MAEFENVALTAREIEAVLKALLECGANRDQKRLFEVFHDPELMSSAQSARGELMRRQRSNRSAGPDYLRQLEKQKEEADQRRSALQNLRGDYADLLGSVHDLLQSLMEVQERLREGQWIEGRMVFDKMLVEFTWREDRVAETLHALREAADETKEAPDLPRS